jgi:ATP-binding cassette subfamily C protein CydD
VEPGDGTIDVDGVHLATLDPAAWRRSVAWLPQHPHLFDGSVAANVRLGADAATDDEVRAALRGAAVETVVEALPDGLATRLGEDGARLSGGEVARIAIARALVRAAPLLIVDEPTAHLDEDTAALVRAALLNARRTSTVLAISHDDGLAAIADHVVTLDAGRTVAPVARRRTAERHEARVAWVSR